MRQNRLLTTGIVGFVISMLGCVTPGLVGAAGDNRHLGKRRLARLCAIAGDGDFCRVDGVCGRVA